MNHTDCEPHQFAQKHINDEHRQLAKNNTDDEPQQFAKNLISAFVKVVGGLGGPKSYCTCNPHFRGWQIN